MEEKYIPNKDNLRILEKLKNKETLYRAKEQYV